MVLLAMTKLLNGKMDQCVSREEHEHKMLTLENKPYETEKKNATMRERTSCKERYNSAMS